MYNDPRTIARKDAKRETIYRDTLDTILEIIRVHDEHGEQLGWACVDEIEATVRNTQRLVSNV